ncbi:unnamed protein product [Chondrus crispus]|uniref:Uncharacterized protein n=1 Tax=Chondrus crispus TaxID=2769 RepID=S0F334_CHOCR|nr:unnamed protein product [Chondrus crispus]CDF77606.1 unnamed protein product [Chondrus crispus]|eukprot:XP_005718949.1 unnamed protein product [Chondrus crispus]
MFGLVIVLASVYTLTRSRGRYQPLFLVLSSYPPSLRLRCHQICRPQSMQRKQILPSLDSIRHPW